jgi:transporter family-2 protein
VLAALISFMVGTAVLLIVWLISGNRPGEAALARLPWYAWLGGIYGAIYVGIAAFAAPKIGLASLITIGIAGQIVSAMVLDHFGVLGLPKDPFSFVRLAGAALVVAGVILVRRG